MEKLSSESRELDFIYIYIAGYFEVSSYIVRTHKVERPARLLPPIYR